jgi:membrane protease YdiL (CAAX protease family)
MATLIGAVLICAGIVFIGPQIGNAIIEHLPDARRNDLPLLETLLTLLIFGPLLLFAVIGARLAGYNALALGRRPARRTGLGLAIGAAGVAAAVGYCTMAGVTERGAAAPIAVGLLLWGSAVTLVAAAAEEAFFRGWLQPVLVRQFGTPVAILLAAIAFAALHVMGGARSGTTLLNLFLGGLLFGFLAARGGGIAGAVAAHFAWNWSERIALGLDPNPGWAALARWSISI